MDKAAHKALLAHVWVVDLMWEEAKVFVGAYFTRPESMHHRQGREERDSMV